MQMKGLLFFLDKFGLHLVSIKLYSRMIIATVPESNIGLGTFKVALK
jgi:hypothetical protein